MCLELREGQEDLRGDEFVAVDIFKIGMVDQFKRYLVQVGGDVVLRDNLYLHFIEELDPSWLNDRVGEILTQRALNPDLQAFPLQSWHHVHYF